MEYEKNICPVLDVDGVLATGKQFDLDIILPEDNRSVIYGIVKDCCQEPISDAVVKLVEIVYDCGKEERKPVSHTFTDKSGEFVFGPLCPNKFYAVEIWVDQVKHCKICTKPERDGKCLKGIKLDCKNDCICINEKKDPNFTENCNSKEEDFCKENKEVSSKKDKASFKPCFKPC